MSKETIEWLIAILGAIAGFLIAPITFRIFCAIWAREDYFIDVLLDKIEEWQERRKK